MLSIGWPEMMVVAAAALIIVGPRDLPALLRNIGRVVSKARRMGNEFRAEINKVAALDDVKDIRKSITAPLAETSADIQKQFNKIRSDGSVVPSGKITPKDPKVESVFDEIKSATAKTTDKASPAKKAASAKARANATKSKPVKSKPASKSVAKKPVTKKSATKKAVAKKASVKKTATKKAAPRAAAKKTTTLTATKVGKTTVLSKPTTAKKPAAAKSKAGRA